MRGHSVLLLMNFIYLKIKFSESQDLSGVDGSEKAAENLEQRVK
jgi:hypothetical protein